MELQQEVEAFYIIPAVRRELARQMITLGLSQRDVAKRLRVTDAAVSQYLSNKRGSPLEYGPTVAAAIHAAAARVKDSADEGLIRKEIDALCELLKRERVICDIHRKHATVKDGCSSCFE